MNFTSNISETFVTLDRYSDNADIIFSKREISANHIVPAHWHEFFELEFIVKGSAKHYINNEENSLKEGSAYIMSHCDFHSIHPNENIVLYNLSFMPNCLDKTFSDSLYNKAGGIGCEFENENLQLVLNLFERGIDYCENKTEYSDVMLKSIATYITALTLENANYARNPQNTPLIGETVALINAEFNTDITLAKAAKRLHISPNYLGCVFKKQVGVSFNGYLNRIRLKYACTQLLTTEKYVKEIAYESGFCSSEYFLSVFKKQMGCTPSEYRGAGKYA